MLETFKKALKVKEIRKRLLYTFFILIVVRLGCQIPIPFVNGDAIAQVMRNFANENFSFFSAITGGSMEKMSIFALNITPYITASIIMQLLTIAIPKLDELQKDGEEGRKKIAEVTRYLTVALALIESTAMIIGFGNQGIFDTDAVKYSAMHDIRKWGVIVTGILEMVFLSFLQLTSFQVCLVILLTYSRTLYLKKECQSVVDYYQHALFWAL